MSLLYLYLSRKALALRPAALDAGYWGLNDEAAQRSIERIGDTLIGLQVLQSLQVDDQILVASGGPQARVPRGEWADVTLAEGFIWRVTKPYYESAEPPLEDLPHRFGIEEVEQLQNLTHDDAGLNGLDALHYSANFGGLLVPVEGGVAPVFVSAGPLAAGETEDPGLLAVDGGNLDAALLNLVRQEQRQIRAKVFGDGPNGTCALCDRTLPLNLMRTAYIKPPSECSADERRDLNNIVPLCTLGCDFLFRTGDVYVDSSGTVARQDRELSTPDFDEQVKALVGNHCSTHNSSSEPYFRWHREHVSPA
jgi:hypothetical protein